MQGRLLVAYSNSANYVSTTAEYLASFGQFSSFDVRYLHVTHGAEPVVDLSEYDAVLNSYCARFPIEGCVSPAWRQMLTEFQGVKALAVQDEYDYTNRLHAAIRDVGFDVVFTNVPQDGLHKVYPPAAFPGVEFVTVLTGYVPDALVRRGNASRPMHERPITVGYRGRDLSPRYGQLAWDKRSIAEGMLAILRARCDPFSSNIVSDIRSGEGDRLYGNAWYEWIGSCRSNLAVETGSNAFDWDGEIADEYARRAAADPAGRVDWLPFLAWLRPYERDYDMGQISARVFEAAAMRTGLICFPGRFSGILEPDKHYLPLERDFSNVGDILSALDNIPALNRMVERTWSDLIGSRRYCYERLVETVDAALLRAAAVKGVKLAGRPLPDDGYEPPFVDSPAARSFVERPTRQPQSPLLYSFKQVARMEALLVEDCRRMRELFAALEYQTQQQGDALQREVNELRQALLMAQSRQAAE